MGQQAATNATWVPKLLLHTLALDAPLRRSNLACNNPPFSARAATCHVYRGPETAAGLTLGSEEPQKGEEVDAVQQRVVGSSGRPPHGSVPLLRGEVGGRGWPKFSTKKEKFVGVAEWQKVI